MDVLLSLRSKKPKRHHIPAMLENYRLTLSGKRSSGRLHDIKRWEKRMGITECDELYQFHLDKMLECVSFNFITLLKPDSIMKIRSKAGCLR